MNIPLPFPVDPLDTITTTPGLVVYDNDGIPTRIASESPYPVPIAPLPVTKHFLKRFNDKQVPRQMYSAFTLPFPLLAQASFTRTIKRPPEEGCRIHFHRPHFNQLRGGLQIKARAPAAPSLRKRPFFTGWTGQIETNLKWSLWGLPLTGSTLLPTC